MKKLSLFITCLLLSLSLVACSGCSHNDDDGDGKCDACGESMTPSCDCTECKDSDGDGKCDACGKSVNTSAGNVEFIKDGVPNFQFVVNSQSVSSEIMYQITQLANSINGLTSGGVEVVIDDESNKKPNEVLFGTVKSRGASCELDGHDWGMNGWAIKVIDSKIVVVGGSDDALKTAIATLKRDVFGIKSSTEEITDLTVTASMAQEKAPPEYTVKSVYVGDNDLRDMAITYSDNFTRTIATNIQDVFYRYTGIYLNIFKSGNTDKKALLLSVIENGGEGTTDEGCRVYVNDGNLVLETEFPERFSDKVTLFLTDYIINASESTVSFSESFDQRYNVRDIYYSEFNAKGDGVTDDFMAVKAAHDYANLYGHRVNADKGAIYYFGKGSGTNTISIQTDTNWHGCKFIFDDSNIAIGSDEFNTAVFTVSPDTPMVRHYGENVPINSLEKGAANIGWAPGYPAMIIIYNDNVKHYIRYGTNANDGSSQRELIVVDAEGNVDPSTPIQWTYEAVTAFHVCRIDDKPIVISGADDGEYAEIETIFNGSETLNTYYQRNILIKRSNVLIKNVNHVVTGEIPESEGGTGTPYGGFTQTTECNNVVYKNFIFHKLTSYHLKDKPDANVGSYEVSATMANNVTWKDCSQDVFFDEDGGITSKGIMGTNFCKNLTFDNVLLCSFDAHQGVYNATLKNSTCEHINFIGSGTITLENVTIYADPMKTAINLRNDYGSTWNGDIVINGLNIKYTKAVENSDIYLISATWVNHDFGYTTYLPQNIYMNDVRMVKYEYGIENGERYENVVAVNEKTLLIFPVAISHKNPEIGQEVFSNGIENKNINVATKSITVTNSSEEKPLTVEWPTSAHFKNTKVTVDGEEIIIGEK